MAGAPVIPALKRLRQDASCMLNTVNQTTMTHFPKKTLVSLIAIHSVRIKSKCKVISPSNLEVVQKSSNTLFSEKNDSSASKQETQYERDNAMYGQVSAETGRQTRPLHRHNWARELLHRLSLYKGTPRSLQQRTSPVTPLLLFHSFR